MNVTLNRAELLAAAKRAANVAPADAPLETLRGVLLEANDKVLTLNATNMEIALEQKIPCAPKDNDALVINAKLLMEMLEKLGGESVDLYRNGPRQSLTVKSGEAVFHLGVWEKGSFPKMEIPFPEDTVQVSGIPGMVKRTVFAVGHNNDQPLLKCVNLMFTKDGLRAVGSDGNCLVSAHGDDKSTGNINLLLPAHSLTRLARICDDKDEFRVGTTGNSIVFVKENLTYSARLMDGDYIDSEKLIGMVTNEFTVLTDILGFRKALLSATALDRDGKVKLSFEGNQITFAVTNAYGTGSASLEVIPLTGVPRGDYWYQTKQLFGCLGSLTGTVTLGIAQSGMLTLSAQNAFYVQTAVRPEVATAQKAKPKVKPKQKAA